MQKVKGIKLACLAAFAILPVQAYALGVGKLTMHSALDEPLSATIELNAATTAEMQTLEVKLGSAGVFASAGIERGEALRDITFTIAKEKGKDVIKLKTQQPFNAPFLHFIVKATWANGSMLREYTALLDPPTYLIGTPARIQAPSVAKPVRTKSVAKKKSSKPTKSATKSKATPSVVATSAGKKKLGPTADKKLGPSGMSFGPASNYSDLRPGSTYGPVKNGDALWNIAESVQAGTGLGIAQVMMAIFKQNPSAFMNNNINLIRVGKTLEIPSDEVISSTGKSAAQNELRAQMEEWQEYKENLSSGRSMAMASPKMETKVPERASATRKAEKETSAPMKKAEKKTRMPAANKGSAGSDDVLEIVRAKVEGAEPGGSGVSADDKIKYESAIDTYRENVSQLEETLASSELEKMELSERVSLLEDQIDKANKLIDMQNSDLARMQGQAQAEMATPIVATAPIEPIKPVETAEPARLPEPVVESKPMSAPDTSPIATPKPVVKRPVVAEKKVTKTRVAPAPDDGTGLVATAKEIIFSSWITMLGTALALLLVLVGIFVVLRRRRSIAEFEDSIISGTAVLDISTAESSEPSDSGSETSFLSDFVPGMGNMQADEVDPLAEAEVYMAYGRDEQAEEVLKDAAGKNPDRHELKLKLLEIYQGRKDVSSFETLAEELYPADGNVPMEVWSKVAEMGKIVNPDNPLFQGDITLKEDTLFGGGDRKEDVELSDLLDTETVESEEADLIEALDLDEDTEEVTEESLPAVDVASDQSADTSTAKGDDFPVPEEEVLDLDLGDFTPDEDHETDSFDVDSMELNLSELEKNAAEEDEADAEGVDFNLDGIDLDLDESKASGDSDDASVDMAGIDNLDLDLGSESSDENTSEVSIQDETLEFADLGDLALDEDVTASATSDKSEDEDSAEIPAGADETWDEAGTKLDLAKAYIEMDDNESAQSILEEVAKEGTDMQKNEARDLMNQINAS